MNEQDLKNKEIFLECVKRYDNKKKENAQPLYIEDLNIIRTIFLWMYPPFLQEYVNVKNSQASLEQDDHIEEIRMLGTFPVSKSKPRIDKYKIFCEKWNVSLRTEYTGLTSINKILNPLNYPNRVKGRKDEQVKFYPCSNYPSPVKPISKLKARDLNRISTGNIDSLRHEPFPINVITMNIDIRWDISIISKEIEKYIKEYKQDLKKNEFHQIPKLKYTKTVAEINETIPLKLKMCPSRHYFDYFYFFAIEERGYQDIADLLKIRGDQPRGHVKDGIKWITDFIDYDSERAKNWAKSIVDKAKKAKADKNTK